LSLLTSIEVDFYQENGYLVIENAVDSQNLAKLQAQFATWVEQSRDHLAPYGRCVDGRARFDLEAGHTREKPALRRVNAPVEVSSSYFSAMHDSRMTDAVAELIGPDVKFHHSKINSKLPGGNTEVKWHQDFPFTPHTNDDIVTALLMVDDVTEENGPLEVVPGSHRGEIHGLWHNDTFTGTVADDVTARCKEQAVVCTGKAGSACLMHTRLLHGSAPNLSDSPRTLFICVYSAADALPCSPNPMPTSYQGRIVRGAASGSVRSIPFELKLPEIPKTASFFDQQDQHKTN